MSGARSVSHSYEDVETETDDDEQDFEDPPRLRDAGVSTDDEFSSGDVITRTKFQRRKRCLCALIFCWLAALAIPGVYTMLPKAANFMLTDLGLSRVDVPGLGIGLVPADTSRCPGFDPCGTVSGCSNCPAGYVNRGCVCLPPKPGTIIESDHSSCPLHDLCGVWPSPYGAKGCSSCPDSTWINEGCTCQQPFGVNDAVASFDRFANLLTGKDEYPLILVLQATVLVCNPNVLGAKTDPGVVTISWQGNEIGNASFEPLQLAAKSTSTVGPITVTVNKVSPPVGIGMVQHLLKNEATLDVDVAGSLTARVLGVWPVTTTVTCKVTANLLLEHIIDKKDCIYGVNGLLYMGLAADYFQPSWEC